MIKMLMFLRTDIFLNIRLPLLIVFEKRNKVYI